MQCKTKTDMWKLDGPLMHKTFARGNMRLVQRICLVWCLPAMVSGEMRQILDSRAAGFSYVDSRAYGFNCFNYVLWLHHYHHYTHTSGKSWHDGVEDGKQQHFVSDILGCSSLMLTVWEREGEGCKEEFAD